jgi:hypothetical protein
MSPFGYYRQNVKNRRAYLMHVIDQYEVARGNDEHFLGGLVDSSDISTDTFERLSFSDVNIVRLAVGTRTQSFKHIDYLIRQHF